MPLSWTYALISVVVVSLISLVGVFTLSVRANKFGTVLVYLISFAAGALLGDVFLHLLPELVEESGFTQQISIYILTGVVATFLLEKTVHWHHNRTDTVKKLRPAVFTTLFGDGVHNFVDGIIIAGSYLVSVPLGLATTIAVVLHEIPQEIGNFAVLVHGGLPARKALFYNFLSAVTAVAGTILALVLGTGNAAITAFLTAFTAGNFIYIVGVDLIPELHKEVSPSRSALQLLFFVGGIGAMAMLLLLE